MIRLCIVLLVVNCAIRLALASGLPLFPDEAYFWEWSRFPSLGYLDHPPMVAWVIGLFTWPFSERSPVLVRGGALLLGTGSLLLIYRLALLLFEDRTVAGRALLLALCLPAFNTVGAIIAPYGPLVFFHLLALNFLIPALRNLPGRSRYWYAGGVALGLALLSKLMAMLSLAALFLFLAVSSSHRFWWRRKELYIALLLALLTFSPFVYWNLTNDWAGFRLQLWDRHQSSLGASFGKFGEFLVEQLANTSLLALPLLGCLFVRSTSLPAPWEAYYRLIKYQSLMILGFFLMVGTITQTHPHWTTLAYPTAAIALAALWTSVPGYRLVRGLRWWIGLSYGMLILAICLVLTGASVVSNAALTNVGGSLGRGLAKGQVRLLGWSELRRQLDPFLQQAAGDREARLFMDNYERAAQLSFHHEGEPVINLAAYVRKEKEIGDAQAYYLPIEQLDGTSGFFLSDRKGMTASDLREVFGRMEQLGIVEQRDARQVLGEYRVFRVEQFKSKAMISVDFNAPTR